MIVEDLGQRGPHVVRKRGAGFLPGFQPVAGAVIVERARAPGSHDSSGSIVIDPILVFQDGWSGDLPSVDPWRRPFAASSLINAGQPCGRGWVRPAGRPS